MSETHFDIASSIAARKVLSEQRKKLQEELKLHWTWKFAVVKKCRNCTNNTFSEIKHCPVLTCALWPGRMGHMCSGEDMKRWEAEFLNNPLNQEIIKVVEEEEVPTIKAKDW